MMPGDRAVVEGRQYQGTDEIIAYNLTTTPWGSAPAGAAVKGYDVTAGAYTDVSATIISGAPVTVGDVIQFIVKSLTLSHEYRVEVKFTSGASTFEPYVEIEAER